MNKNLHTDVVMSTPSSNSKVEESWEKDVLNMSEAGWIKITVENMTGYIKGLLSQARQEERKSRTEELTDIVEWCEGMKKSEDKYSKRHNNQVLWTDIGYNQAIKDFQVYIKSLIGEKE